MDLSTISHDLIIKYTFSITKELNTLFKNDDDQLKSTIACTILVGLCANLFIPPFGGIPEELFDSYLTNIFIPGIKTLFNHENEIFKSYVESRQTEVDINKH